VEAEATVTAAVAAAEPEPEPEVPSKMFFAQLTAGRCHGQLFGTPMPGKPLTVLVHGINAGKFVFVPLASDLVRHGHAVLTFDLYGRGQSDLTEHVHKAELFVAQLAELLFWLGPSTQYASCGPINLVGISLGGAISGVYASVCAAFEGACTDKTAADLG
jgi:pimeloyl-ACP methyl ester carboxylesterase